MLSNRRNRLSRTPLRVMPAVALAAGLLVGCGGPFAPASDEPSVEPLPAASSVEVPDTVVPESDTGAVDEGSAPEESAAGTEPSDGDAAACASLQEAWSATNQALVNLSSDHPRTIVNSFRTAGEAMAGVEALDAVADDWAAMSAYLRRVNAALDDVDPSDADAVASALSAAISADDTKAVTAAAGRITDFLAADCAAP